MPSIRHSLIAYFLLLLGVALAGVAILYDRLASEAVEERKTAELILIRQKLENRNQDASEKLNSELLLHAKALGREIRQKIFLFATRSQDQAYVRRIQNQVVIHPLGFAGLSPWSSVVSVAATSNRTNFNNIVWNALTPPGLDEIVRQTLEIDDHSGIYQIHMPRNKQAIRPTGQTVLLPLDPVSFEKERDPNSSGDYYKTDEVEVVGDEVYRRVIYRQPVWIWTTQRNPPRPPNNPPRDGPQGSRPAGSPGFGSRPPGPGTELQTLYVQYARKRSELDAIYHEHNKTAEEEKNKVVEATQARITWLRSWMIGIGSAAFVAMVAGGWLLIGRGLAPLANLSEAVSRVSTTNFTLPIERSQLSEELLPIHDRLTQTLDALKRAFEREKQSVADISHELRTPLAALLTTIEVSLRKPRDAEKYRQTLTECRDIGQQLNKLVNRILTLANLDAGNVHAQKVTIGVEELVHDCSAIIKPLATSHDLCFRLDIEAGLMLETDPDKLREVLMNLLHNAIEYNRPHGSIVLTVSFLADQKLISFEVSDTGIGMTPEVQSKIFERFYRADQSRSAAGVHAGLGLSIVKEYVDRLGGTIEVESQPDVGTTFRVKLPGISHQPTESELVMHALA